VAAVIGAAAAAALAGAAQLGRPGLVALLIPTQFVLAICWLAYVAAPGWIAGTMLAGGAAVAGDLLATRPGDPSGALAGVVALAVVLAILAALVRRQRTAVADTLAAQISAVLVVIMPATYVALRGQRGGHDAVLVGLLALAGAAVLGRLATALIPVAAWSVPSFVVGVGCWAATGALIGAALRSGDGALLGAAAAGAGGLADLAGAGSPGRRRSLLLGALLPLSIAAPVTYVLGRVMLG
jgi:hypothetical protein